MRNRTENPKVRVEPIRLEDLGDSEELKKKIAVRAYEIFERHGRIPNHDIDDWLEAESEINSELH